MEQFLKEIIREAGFIAKGYYEQGISHKFKSNPDDFVTEADIEVDKFLTEKIKEKYPDHGILSEETEEVRNPDAEYMWVMDPIDGTRNFAKHIGVWCTMIGIAKNDKPYMAAIYDALNDELFFAKKGEGAFLNDQPIKVSDCQETRYAFVTYSGGFIDDGNSPYATTKEKYERYLKFYNNLVADHGHWVHHYGTMLSLCHLAAGRVDVGLYNSGMYHDYLAPYIIATEAGAKFTDSEGNDWKRGRKDIVVANPKLHKKLMKLFD